MKTCKDIKNIEKRISNKRVPYLFTHDQKTLKNRRRRDDVARDAQGNKQAMNLGAC